MTAMPRTAARDRLGRRRAAQHVRARARGTCRSSASRGLFLGALDIADLSLWLRDRLTLMSVEAAFDVARLSEARLFVCGELLPRPLGLLVVTELCAQSASRSSTAAPARPGVSAVLAAVQDAAPQLQALLPLAALEVNLRVAVPDAELLAAAAPSAAAAAARTGVARRSTPRMRSSSSCSAERLDDVVVGAQPPGPRTRDSSSVRAVRKMMGTRFVRGAARKRRQISRPSRSGSIWSSSTRSGQRRCTSANAARPSAPTTSYPPRRNAS